MREGGRGTMMVMFYVFCQCEFCCVVLLTADCWSNSAVGLNFKKTTCEGLRIKCRLRFFLSKSFLRTKGFRMKKKTVSFLGSKLILIEKNSWYIRYLCKMWIVFQFVFVVLCVVWKSLLKRVCHWSQEDKKNYIQRASY